MKRWFKMNAENEFVMFGSYEERPKDTKFEKWTDVPINGDSDMQGFMDGSKAIFDEETQTWHPYKEPVKPSPEMQAINQIGLQVAKLMAGGEGNG